MGADGSWITEFPYTVPEVPDNISTARLVHGIISVIALYFHACTTHFLIQTAICHFLSFISNIHALFEKTT